MSNEKVSRWDIKKALKLLGMDTTDENVNKINEFRGEAPIEATVEEAASLTESKNDSSLVAVTVVQQEKDYLVVKVPFTLENAEVLFKTDYEPRAIIERGRFEAEIKTQEYKKQRQGEKK